MERSGARTTLYVIAYDIPDDRRRTRLHKLLCGYGQWTQYSLFECFLEDKQLLVLQDKMEGLLNPQEDSVRFYHVCAGCVPKTHTIGSARPAERIVFVV